MTCGYRNPAGTDLDSLFYTSNKNVGAVGFRQSNGVDLGNKYAHETVLGYSVGYRNSAGTDLGFLRGNFNPSERLGIYKPSGWPWDVGLNMAAYNYRSEICTKWCEEYEGSSYCCESDSEHYIKNPECWIDWWNSHGVGSCVKVNGIMNDAIFRQVHSSYHRSVGIFAHSPNSDFPVTNITCTEECFGFTHNRWSKMLTANITVNDCCKGIVFCPSTGAGGKVWGVYTITATFANYGDMVYKAAIGAYVDSNMPVYGSSTNLVSYNCNGVNHYHHG